MAERSAVIFIGCVIIVAAWVKMVNSEEFSTLFRSEDFTTFYDSVFHIVTLAAFFILIETVGELLMRIFFLIEERLHIMGRYDGNWGRLLKDLFSFCQSTQYAVGISFLIVLMYYMKTGSLPWDRSPILQFMMVIFAYIASKLLKLDKSQLMDNIQMERMQPLDYGSGMALNFFYGYLRLVLPTKGEGDKGLKERIQDYMDIQNITEEELPVKKLFILVPSSTFVPPNLEAVSYGWMEAAQSLEKQLKDRAGVIARSYKNSVYKIQDPNGSNPPVYVVAEGATPLKTLNEAILYSGKRKDFFIKHQKQIILSFYECLRQILREDRDCYDLCELVYYVDVDDHGLPNVNAARKILDRIEEIKLKEAELQYLRGEL
ncbi:stimulator of interferon genes protein homolog isoform X2 [Anabrus simplex]